MSTWPPRDERRPLAPPRGHRKFENPFHIAESHFRCPIIPYYVNLAAAGPMPGTNRANHRPRSTHESAGKPISLWHHPWGTTPGALWAAGPTWLPIASETHVGNTLSSEESLEHLDITPNRREISVDPGALELPSSFAVKIEPLNNTLTMANPYAFGPFCTGRCATHAREDLKVSIMLKARKKAIRDYDLVFGVGTYAVDRNDEGTLHPYVGVVVRRGRYFQFERNRVQRCRHPPPPIPRLRRATSPPRTKPSPWETIEGAPSKVPVRQRRDDQRYSIRQ